MKHFLILVLFFYSTISLAVGSPKASKKGTFYYSLNAEPKSLNPITTSELYSRYVRAYITETLMNRDVDTYKWKPLLAESYTTSKDGKMFTFKLRKELKWHDGKPVTAKDVKFSFDVIFIPEYKANHLRPYYEGVEYAKVIDDHTIAFKMKQKYFKNFDVVAGLTVIPMHIYKDAKKGAKKNKSLIGTGPYKLEKWQKGRRIILKRNKSWWGNNVLDYKAEYNFNKIIFRFVGEDNIRLEMLKKGDLDFVDMDNPEIFVKKAVGPLWGKKVFKKKVSNSAPKAYRYIGFNFKREIWQDLRVRQAMAHLVNRQFLNDKFRFGMSELATGPYYRKSPYANKSIKPFEFNPKKSLKLLKAAGWADTDKDGVLDKVINGKKVDFRFTLINANKVVMKYYTVFKEDAKKIGVDVQLKLLEWNALVKLLDEKNFDAVTMGWGGGSVEPDPKQIWHSSSSARGGSNYISYSNKKVDTLIDQLREELNEKKRIPLHKKIHKLIHNDVPYVFLFNDKFEFYGHTERMQMEKDTYNYSVGLNYWWFQ